MEIVIMNATPMNAILTTEIVATAQMRLAIHVMPISLLMVHVTLSACQVIAILTTTIVAVKFVMPSKLVIAP